MENIMSHVLKFVITLAGCSIAAALAIRAPMSAAGTQAAMPEWRSLLDQHVVLVRAPRHEPSIQRAVSPVIEPIGKGWG
jgi:hypothetical protein